MAIGVISKSRPMKCGIKLKRTEYTLDNINRVERRNIIKKMKKDKSFRGVELLKEFKNQFK